MNPAQVRAAAGTPRKTTTFTACCGVARTYEYGTLSVSFLGQNVRELTHVRWLTTTSTAYRTSTGIGVGSSRAQLLARVTGVRCGVYGVQTLCLLGKTLDDPRQTLFALENGRVATITVGFQPE
jgi:hypothetical protein